MMVPLGYAAYMSEASLKKGNDFSRKHKTFAPLILAQFK